MIGKVTRGTDVADLIRYLYGPGRYNEHTNPHIVAGYLHPSALEPALRPDGERGFRHLINTLNSPLETLRRTPPAQPVWQCSIRAAPTDRTLSDAEWADIAEEVMHQTGIAPRGDDRACHWIAVRHADDHIHLVATLARDDGRVPRLRRDYFQVRDACRIVEQRYQLRPTAPADRTAAPRPTRAETEHAHRTGRPEPPRTTLRRHVATAAAAAASEEEFFAHLDKADLLIRKRYSTRNPGEVTGYAVALPHHVNRNGQPVWFSGGKLAPDLTIPKLRRRWSAPSGPAAAYRPVRPPQSTTVRRSAGADLTPAERAGAYRQAVHAAATAAQQMRWTTDPRIRADIAAATADALHVAAAATGNRHLTDAADSYDRAAREPYGHQPAPTLPGSALRTAVRILAITCINTRNRRDRSTELTVELLMLIAHLAALAEAVADFRETQQRHPQADAARTAARHLHRVRRQPPAAPPPVIRQPTESPTAAELAATDFPIPLHQLLGRTVSPHHPAANPRPEPRPLRRRAPGDNKGPRDR